MSVVYHVFTDRKDSYPNTLKEAQAQFEKWKTEGEVNIRIYKLRDAEKETTEKEEYIQGIGDFPI